MTFKTPTPGDIQDFRERYGMSQRELGEALGFSEEQASRVVRGWEKGVRQGQPYHPTATAVVALHLLHAMLDALDHVDEQIMRRVLKEALPASVPWPPLLRRHPARAKTGSPGLNEALDDLATTRKEKPFKW